MMAFIGIRLSGVVQEHRYCIKRFKSLCEHNACNGRLLYKQLLYIIATPLVSDMLLRVLVSYHERRRRTTKDGRKIE